MQNDLLPSHVSTNVQGNFTERFKGKFQKLLLSYLKVPLKANTVYFNNNSSNKIGIHEEAK